MNYFRILFYILYISCAFTAVNAQNILVDGLKTPQQLIENVLVNNSTCLTINNTAGKGDGVIPVSPMSYAYFNANSSSFPFSEGVVLSTSMASQIAGPYLASNGGGSNVWPGDADLDQALGITSVNATVLEFDFVPLTDLINFNYIFASNEYQYGYPCQYSDGFAFLIKEVGTADPYKNLALIPNTTIPVSSFNIHPTIVPGKDRNNDPYQGCPAVNPQYFNGFNPSTAPINFTAQTVVMNARTTVTPGKTYHIKLVIGDDRFEYYDSAVFLQAGSFTSQINFGEDRTVASNNPVCFGETVPLNTNLPASYSYKWFKDGVQITDANNNFYNAPLYNATTSGIYKVEATLPSSTCTLTGQIKLEFAPEILTTNTTIVQCDDDTDGVTIFNLTKSGNIIKNNAAETTVMGYYETLADAEAKVNPILTPEKYSNKSTNQVVFGRIENRYGCFKTAEVTLQISNNTIPNQSPASICDEDDKQDGFYQFNLDQKVTPQLIFGLPTGMIVHYFLNAGDAMSELNQLPNIYKNTTAFSQTIYGRVINGADCYDIVPITLQVNTFDPPNFEDETQPLCKGSEITLTVATGFASYLWNTGSTDNFIKVNTAGDYQVTVTDNNGCPKTKKYKVIQSEPATITGAVVKDFSANENSVLLEYSGSGDYEFSIDGSVFQEEPLFNAVAPGVYEAIARDKNGCGPSNSYKIYVLDYPRFFTPNGDTYNDLWYIKNLNQFPDYTITIFDRYGKLLKQMNQNSTGWNGIFNGQQLPSSDYWFNLLFSDGRTVKGHFSLKR